MVAPRTRPDTWWWPGPPAPGARPVLFFPASGAEPSSARPLVEHAAGLRFGVVQLPGRGTRHDEPDPHDVTALVEEIADAVAVLDGPPPVLAGHSFGGLLAYGVVDALERRGVAVGRLVAVASASPPWWTAELAADRVAHSNGSRADFVRRRAARILDGDGVPAALLAHPEFADRARHLVETDVGLSFGGFPVRPVRTPVTLVVARHDTVVDAASASGWREVAAGPFERRDVPGDHFFYRGTPQRLVALLRLEVQALDIGGDIL